MPSKDLAASRPAVYSAIIFLTLFALYSLGYLHYSAAPGGSVEQPIGWIGWYDQGQYFKGARALAALDFSPAMHVYPPLWPLMGAVFLKWWPTHPFFIPGFICLAIHVGVLLWIGERLYGRALTWIVVPLVFILWPTLTTTQWIIPWTTSPTAAFISILFAIYFHFDTKPDSWAVVSRRDWLLIAIFFLSYGLTFAARPVDVLPIFPIALIFVARIAYQNVFSFSGLRDQLSYLTGAILVVIVTLSGLVGPVGYFVFNTYAFGDPLGGYLSLTQSIYQIHIVFARAVSLLIDSEALFVESGAISTRFPLLLLCLSIFIIIVFTVNGLRRMVAVTALCYFLVYLPFTDLLPNNIFRFFTIHYFKWVFPWLTLLSAGELLRWFGRNPKREIAFVRIGATAALMLTLANIRIVFPTFDMLPDQRDLDARRIVIDAGHTRNWEVLDLMGVRGGFNDVYMASHQVEIDGVQLHPRADFKVLPSIGGVRIIFFRVLSGRQVQVAFTKPVDVGPRAGVTRVGLFGYSLTCAIRKCLPINRLPLTQLHRFVIELKADGNGVLFTKAGWSDPESWGRWSTKHRATVSFAVDERRRDVGISIVANGLLSPRTPLQAIWIEANGCKVAEAMLDLQRSSDFQTISGEIPARCIPSDGLIELAVVTDRTTSPREVGLNSDTRPLGAAVREISIHDGSAERSSRR